MKQRDTIRSLECCVNQENCSKCPYHIFGGIDRCLYTLLSDVLALVYRLKERIKRYQLKNTNQKDELARLNKQVAEQKAEIERLQKKLEVNSFVVPCRNSGKSIRAAVRICDLMDEAIENFAKRLCEGRVSNDPVVIAVKTELKMMEEEFDNK